MAFCVMLYVFNDFILDTPYNLPHNKNPRGNVERVVDELTPHLPELCFVYSIFRYYMYYI